MFRHYVEPLQQYRDGQIDADTLVSTLQALDAASPAPNPQRICFLIELSNVLGPIIASFMEPPIPWPVIPLPAFCTIPTPTGTVPRIEVHGLTEAANNALSG